KKLAESIRDSAKKGEDFAQLAKEFSEDPGSKDKGGEYTFGRNQMVPEFVAAAFSLTPGEVSDVVTCTYGYSDINEFDNMQYKKNLEEVKDQDKKILDKQEVEKQLPDFMKNLQKEGKVEILDESLKIKEELETPANPASAAPTAK